MKTSHHEHTHIRGARRLTARHAGLVLLGALLAAPAVGQTRAVEPPPPREADFDTISAWISSNPTHTAVADQLDRLMEAATTVEEVRRIAGEVLPGVVRDDVLAEAAADLARLTMTARDYRTASELAETAYIASGGEDLASLFLQAQALLQIGETDACEQRARMVVGRTDDYELKRRAYALVARAMHADGRSAEAERLLATLAELDDPALVEPDTLLLQSAVRAHAGESGAGPIEQLERLHPQSVAMRLVRGDLVEQAPLPSALIATLPQSAMRGADPALRAPVPDATEAGPEAEPVADALPTRSNAPSVSSIQVGSFSDADNARHLADDLRELGLEVAVETVERNEASLELVLVNVPEGTSASASRVLAVLREAGYDGFLIY
ncbi:MAG: SPOR domain-containing protein [Spirochaetota bacterium]